MDEEKRVQKGGFLQLFDWNVKPRKKFPIRSDLSKGMKNRQEKLVSLKTKESQLMDGNESGSRSQLKGNRDSGFASPLGANDGDGTRAPSVVARLMGLHSLPASTTSESTSVPVSNSVLIQESSGQRSTNSFYFGHGIIHDKDTLRNVSHPIGTVQQRVHSRPIEKFQQEILPPKSARPLPVTHNLLSTFKGPGFMPTSVAYSMEAHTRIIREGPASTSHEKLPSSGSSISLQIRNLKQRQEGSEKGCEISQTSQAIKSRTSYKSRKGQSRENVQIRSGDLQISSTCLDSSREHKDKWVPILKEEKTNVRRKGGLISSRNNGSINRKEGNEAVKLNHHMKLPKSVQKNSVSRTAYLLKKNNQNQNFIANKEKGPGKAPKSKQNEQKSSSINGTVNDKKEIRSLTSYKQMDSTSDLRKHPYPSNSKAFYQMKQSIKSNDHLDVSKNMSHKAARSVMLNVSTDGYMNWDTNTIVGTDVISFTFTSPIKKSMPPSMSSDQGAERDRYGCNGSGGELYDSVNSSLASKSLDELLERKLKELSFRVESSQYMLPDGPNSSSSLKLLDSPLKLKEMCTNALEQGPNFVISHHDDISTHIHVTPDYVDDIFLQDVPKHQPLEQIEEVSSCTNPEYERELAGGYAVSDPDLIYSVESYDSSISKGTQLSSALEIMTDLTPGRIKAYEGVDTELSDSATSANRTDWEVEYLKNVISLAEVSVEDLVLNKGKAAALRQELFERLEHEKIGCDDDEECVKMWRKVLFDYVGESVEEKRNWVSISCKGLSNGRWGLAEELENEMSGWRCVEDAIMVDEVIERDMSRGKGRWVDFGTEALEEGIEIEGEIVTCLVGELVSDFLANGTSSASSTSCWDYI